MRIFVTLGALMFLCAPAYATALIEEEVGVPVSVADGGRARVLTLDALIVRPDDSHRHPLAVLNHGAPRDGAERARMSPRSFRGQAREFARRGFAVVAFTRRGYGRSEGDYVEDFGPCATPDYLAAGRRSAEDVRAMIEAMRARPYVDGARMISVGRSAGGFATVSLSADPPPGLMAAISFAGGRGSRRADEVCAPDKLVAAFAAFGRTSRVPMLWVYAQNDHYFGPALAKRFHGAFTAAGGRAEFVAAPAYGDDGHKLFEEKGVSIWGPYVDDFLARGMATAPAPRAAAALPPPAPMPLAGEAPAGPLPAALGASGKEAFSKYRKAAGHKAFAMSRDGHFGWRSGQGSVDEAVEGASEHCRRNNPSPCHLVSIDDRAVE